MPLAALCTRSTLESSVFILRVEYSVILIRVSVISSHFILFYAVAESEEVIREPPIRAYAPLSRRLYLEYLSDARIPSSILVYPATSSSLLTPTTI